MFAFFQRWIENDLKSVNRITQIVMERGVRPWLKSDWTGRWSSLGRENQKCVDILHNFTNQVIRERRHLLQQTQLDSPSESSSNRILNLGGSFLIEMNFIIHHWIAYDEFYQISFEWNSIGWKGLPPTAEQTAQVEKIDANCAQFPPFCDQLFPLISLNSKDEL